MKPPNHGKRVRVTGRPSSARLDLIETYEGYLLYAPDELGPWGDDYRTGWKIREPNGLAPLSVFTTDRIEVSPWPCTPRSTATPAVLAARIPTDPEDDGDLPDLLGQDGEVTVR